MRKAILDSRVLIAEDLGAAPAPLVLAHPKLHCSAEGCASLPDWLGVRPRLLIYDGVTSSGATTPCAGRRWLEVSYVPDDGAEHRVPLAQARAVPLEQGLPVRRFTSRKGQRHLRGCGGQPQPVATRGLSPGWHTITCCPSILTRPCWASRPSRSGCTDRRGGQAGLARAGLHRPPQRWLGGGGRQPAGGAPQASSSAEVARRGVVARDRPVQVHRRILPTQACRFRRRRAPSRKPRRDQTRPVRTCCPTPRSRAASSRGYRIAPHPNDVDRADTFAPRVTAPPRRRTNSSLGRTGAAALRRVVPGRSRRRRCPSPPSR